MEAESVIEPSTSAWSLPEIIVRKKDGKPRFCIDFRMVNEMTAMLIRYRTLPLPWTNCEVPNIYPPSI